MTFSRIHRVLFVISFLPSVAAQAATLRAPSGFSASAVSASQINLSWSDNSVKETGFEIQRQDSAGGAFSTLVTVGKNVTTYSDRFLLPGSAHSYRIRAVSTNGALPSSYVSSVPLWISTFPAPSPSPTVSPTPTFSPSPSPSPTFSPSPLPTFSPIAAPSPTSSPTPVASPTSAAQGGTFQWVQAFGGTADDKIFSTKIDAAGNRIVAASFSQTVDMGAGPMTAFQLSYQVDNPADMVIVKYSPTGQVLWLRQMGRHSSDYITSMALDSRGDVLVTGTVGPNVDFGSGELPTLGGYDTFVAKYSGINGSYIWAKRVGSPYDEVGFSIAVDRSDNVLVTGDFMGTANFGRDTLTSAGGKDVFLAKFDGVTGQNLWAKGFGGTAEDHGYSVAVDTSGDAVITGAFSGSVNFGDGAKSAGSIDMFLGKYSGTSGSHLWSKTFGSTSLDIARSVTTDSQDNVILTGSFNGNVTFGGEVMAGGYGDISLAKYSSAGTHLWSKKFGGTSGDSGRAVATDGQDNIVLLSMFQGVATFDSISLTAVDKFPYAVTKHSPSGSILWAKQITGVQTLGGSFGPSGLGLADILAITASPSGVYVSGHFNQTRTFVGETKSSSGMMDMFLLKLSP